MSLDASEDAVVGVLKQSLRQLESLGAQRAGLEDMLKEMKRKDDILPKLMATTGSHEDLFRREISKYDHICEEIAENLDAQEQLLMRIKAQNDEFAAIFNLEDYKASREKSYKQIEAAIAKYREMKENINEGLKFYVTLRDAITLVKQQCSDFVMTRSMQCRDMIDDVQRQIAGLSFQDSRSGSAYSSFPPHPTQRYDSGNIPNTTYQPPQPAAFAQTPPPPPYGYAQPFPNHPQQHTVSGRPPYAGWQGPYYNAPPQQMPHPSYPPQSPYPPPNQSGYYKQ